MENYVHAIPTKLYFGKGVTARLAEELGRFGKNVLLVYGGGSIKRSGLYDSVLSALRDGGFAVSELSGVEPNPKIGTVARGAEICREKAIDVILAVGGGSTIDCAKAVAVGTFYDGDLWEMILQPKMGRKALPLVDIVTMSSTGSEFDPIAVISNPETNEKFGAGLLYPTVSFCDPVNTFSVPPLQTASGAIDIMSHIMEDYFSGTPDSDLAEGIAETVLKSVIKNLPIALKEPDNYSARANLMANAAVACSGIPRYGKRHSGWPCHALEHELSAYYDITHGVGLAILTPRWMRFVLKKDPSVRWRFVKFARNVWGLGGDNEDALALAGIDALERFFRESGVPMTLTELGIGTEHFTDMAVHADARGRLSNAWVPLTTEDAVAIFADCL